MTHDKLFISSVCEFYADNKMKRNFTIKLNIRNRDMQDDEEDGSINTCAVFLSSSINDIRKRYLTYQ